MRSHSSKLVRAIAALALALGALSGLAAQGSPPTRAASPDIVVSQVYGGGGNSGATLTHDFVELFNRGSTPVSVNGWSIQYTSATGTGLFGTSPTAITELPNATIQPGQYYLIQQSGGTTGAPLPTPDFIDPTPIAMGAGAGKVALVNTTAPLNCNGGSTPCTPAQLATIVDLVGYGTANFFEGAAAAPTPSATLAVFRASNGCTDTDQNGTDFTGLAVAPRTTASALNPCGPPVTPTITPTAGTPTATATASPTATLPPVTIRIRDIQGAAHRSPLVGSSVTGVPGIVTALRTNGFYLQDPNPDSNNATSEGIFVFTNSAPTVAIGDDVRVNGTVSEFRPGGSGGLNNLSLTQIVSPVISVVSSGNSLPAPVIIGIGGRIPPMQVIDNDATGSVETSGTFDADTDGIDFYESLESMRVQINDAVAVGPTNSFGEIPVLSDNGANAGDRTARGGIIVRPSDFNPERVILDDEILKLPSVGLTMPLAHVGDRIASVVGVLDYSFANFKLMVTQLSPLVSGGIQRESTTPGTSSQLTIASFNVENLDPTDAVPGPDNDSFERLAALIVTNLKSPDILTLEEVQDNNGATNDGVVAADVTLTMLRDAIVAKGGPTYSFAQIDPADDQDGGQPGGNIRVAFFYNPARVSFVSRPGGTATVGTTVLNVSGVPQLQFSPGRIDPGNSAWSASRKPLVGEFVFNGVTVFVIGNHFNSKGGDEPLMGHNQPPDRTSEIQRAQQATLVHNFVTSILAIDASAKVVVAGDLNDFIFSETLNIIRTGTVNGSGPVALINLFDLLPANERYSYVFEGNSQVLDHILVSTGLFNTASPEYDVVHVSSEFHDQSSDHDPSVARFTLSAAPTPTPTSTSTLTPTPTQTSTPTSTPTNTPVPSSTPTNTPAPSSTPTNTPVPSSTPTSTSVPTSTPTATATSEVRTLSSYVAFSASHTRLFAGAQVLVGNVGANTALPCQGAQDRCAEVTLGAGAQMPAGSQVVGDTLLLRPQVQVSNATFNEKLGPGVVSGTSTTPLTLPVLTLPGAAACSPGSNNVTVGGLQSRTLTPGAYGKLEVRFGGTLTLQGGAYCVRSIDLGPGAKLFFTGPSQVTVMEELDAASLVTIGPGPSATTLRARDIVIRVLDVDDRRGGRGDDDDDDGQEDHEDRGRRGGQRAVDVGPHGTIKANILSPNGGIRLGSRTDATGAFIGLRVRVGVQSRLTLDSAF